MICIECGKTTGLDSAFCKHCGKPISNVTGQQPDHWTKKELLENYSKFPGYVMAFLNTEGQMVYDIKLAPSDSLDALIGALERIKTALILENVKVRHR